jgi:hypothetical protein
MPILNRINASMAAIAMTNEVDCSVLSTGAFKTRP